MAQAAETMIERSSQRGERIAKPGTAAICLLGAPPKEKACTCVQAFAIFWLPDLDSNQGPAD
jgi:hypothetical protein